MQLCWQLRSNRTRAGAYLSTAVKTHRSKKQLHQSDLIQQKEIGLEYRNTKEMIASWLTKPLGATAFAKFVGSRTYQYRSRRITELTKDRWTESQTNGAKGSTSECSQWGWWKVVAYTRHTCSLFFSFFTHTHMISRNICLDLFRSLGAFCIALPIYVRSSLRGYPIHIA